MKPMYTISVSELNPYAIVKRATAPTDMDKLFCEYISCFERIDMFSKNGHASRRFYAIPIRIKELTGTYAIVKIHPGDLIGYTHSTFRIEDDWRHVSVRPIARMNTLLNLVVLSIEPWRE